MNPRPDPQYVADLDDPRLAPYRDLRKSKLARRLGLFVCEGRALVERLLASEFEAVSLLVERRFADEYAGRAPAGCEVLLVENGMAERTVGFNFHRGVVGCGRRWPRRSLADWPDARREPLTVLVCVDVRDPENLGAVVRCGAAFGADAVLVTPASADPFSRRVLRTSMGGVLRLPIIESADLTADLAELGRRGFMRGATVLESDAEPLMAAARPPRLALVLGNEGSGLPAEIVAQCDRRLTLPMTAADSLNVAVAAAVFLYHFTRLTP